MAAFHLTPPNEDASLDFRLQPALPEAFSCGGRQNESLSFNKFSHGAKEINCCLVGTTVKRVGHIVYLMSQYR